MDNVRETPKAGSEMEPKTVPETSPAPSIGEVNTTDETTVDTPAETPQKNSKKKKKSKCQKHGVHGSKEKKKEDSKAKGRKKAGSKDLAAADTSSQTEESGSESESDSGSSSDSGSGSSSSSEDEKHERRQRKKKALKLAAAKAAKKARKKSQRHPYDASDSDPDSDFSSSDSGSDPDSQRKPRHKRSGKKIRRRVADPDSDSEIEDEAAEDPASPNNNITDLQTQLRLLQMQTLARQAAAGGRTGTGMLDLHGGNAALAGMRKKIKGRHGAFGRVKPKPAKRASTLEYKRVDQLWDNTIHNYKLTESAQEKVDEFDEYIFTVRRKFDWENKYRNTVVDIKSNLLRDAVAEVMKDIKSVSLVEDQPSLDPNTLFLYLEELRTHYKRTLKLRLEGAKKRKPRKRIQLQRSHLRLMISYLDTDYSDTKKKLFPVLAAGNVTFDLLWALYKPGTIAYTATYGAADEPRCFLIDNAYKESHFVRGEWYVVEGRYLEYDGKKFGLGEFEVCIDSFKGPRKITGLATYPLQYHKDPEGVKKQLIERGKSFVALQGMIYRFHKGLAFMKKKKSVARFNVNGRVMVDPAIFRRINPNYPISVVKPKERYDYSDDEDGCCCSCSEDEEGADEVGDYGEEKESQERTRYKVIRDDNGKPIVVEVPMDENGHEIPVSKPLESLPSSKGEDSDAATPHAFTETELLIASPVVLGFAFSEKLWLEFSLSGIHDIEWNDQAFSSLVLPPSQKSLIKAQVSAHKFHAAQTIDDVVQGKGRGLVFVLHGPPGVGKTLTAEGIAEYLQCPLYAVSAGELGTDSRILEAELQKIMDVAHSWGAILLLDEADVFLERREVHDLHRNALVSIFLRLLEYFQGILFLTTNRVEAFDEAFQSRIQMAIKYDRLTVKAKKEIWKMFVGKVGAVEGVETGTFTESDYNDLSRKDLNGRQIKNAVKSAQNLALHENEPFSMEHIRRYLEVAERFDRDLKGGSGFEEAMRSYT